MEEGRGGKGEEKEGVRKEGKGEKEGTHVIDKYGKKRG